MNAIAEKQLEQAEITQLRHTARNDLLHIAEKQLEQAEITPAEARRQA